MAKLYSLFSCCAVAESAVEMPSETPRAYLIEPFICSDVLDVMIDEQGMRRLQHTPVSGFLEVTIGLFGVAGDMHAMCPSVTVKSGSVLSLVEKFQSGAGINLTPPPADLVQEAVIQVRSSDFVSKLSKCFWDNLIL